MGTHPLEERCPRIISPLYTLRIQLCPENPGLGLLIFPILFGWDWNPQSYSNKGGVWILRDKQVGICPVNRLGELNQLTN